MAANDAINQLGSYATTSAAPSGLAAGGFSALSGKISALLTTGNEASYPTLDFKLDITGGTISAGETVNLYRVAGDSAAQAASGVGQMYVGSFTYQAVEQYYVYGVENVSPDDQFQLENGSSAGTLTGTLSVRSRTITPASA